MVEYILEMTSSGPGGNSGLGLEHEVPPSALSLFFGDSEDASGRGESRDWSTSPRLIASAQRSCQMIRASAGGGGALTLSAQ